ncbi:MAG TPA: DinB family protein [Candidatus Dormibacteraeota bacterium]|nr:DinB family protein [Candidatus Dormibacteraeota bacterium]
MTTPESELVDFQAAYQRFVDAMNGVPTEALTYLFPSDDYSLGGLVTHVNAILRRYGRVLDAILADPTGEIDAQSIDRDKDGENARSVEGLTAPERDAAMTTMAKLHDHVAARLATLSEEDWGRKTPVIFGGSEGQAYPTGAGEIKAWLTGHYDEHVPHVAELLQGWRSGVQPTIR